MIQNSAMLVDLNISLWTARKMDKKVSQEIDSAKNTRSRGGNYHKNLMSGTHKLEQVQKLVSAIRIWHYTNTLPWSDGGSRLLPMTNFFEYKAKLNEFEQEFDTAVRSFLNEYPTLVSAAAFTLGDLFDSQEYPDVSSLVDKFKFKYVFLPVPSAGDFRVDVEDTYVNELKAQYESFYEAKLGDAMADAWNRLHDCLTKMSEKLAGEEKQIFRDSLVTNATDLCSLLTKLNVTNDAKLERARQSLEKALLGVSPDELRKYDDARLDVKAKVDAILDMF
jgi:hypothetical protein